MSDANGYSPLGRLSGLIRTGAQARYDRFMVYNQ